MTGMWTRSKVHFSYLKLTARYLWWGDDIGFPNSRFVLACIIPSFWHVVPKLSLSSPPKTDPLVLQWHTKAGRRHDEVIADKVLDVSVYGTPVEVCTQAPTGLQPQVDVLIMDIVVLTKAGQGLCTPLLNPFPQIKDLFIVAMTASCS